MESIFNTIIDHCNALLGTEEYVVKNFGKHSDLELHFYKDEDYDPDEDPDLSNLVCIVTLQNGKPVDDVEAAYVTDGELYRELERIYNYRNFQTL